MTNDEPDWDKPLDQATAAEIKEAMRIRLGHDRSVCANPEAAMRVYLQMHRKLGEQAAERWAERHQRFHGL